MFKIKLVCKDRIFVSKKKKEFSILVTKLLGFVRIL